MVKPHEIIQRNIEPFYGLKRITIWAKIYASGPFSCRLTVRDSNYQSHTDKITVYNLCWDNVADPIIQYMESEKYLKLQHERQLRFKLVPFVDEYIKPKLGSYEGLLELERIFETAVILQRENNDNHD